MSWTRRGKGCFAIELRGKIGWSFECEKHRERGKRQMGMGPKG